jgi:transcription termination factor Rho
MSEFNTLTKSALSKLPARKRQPSERPAGCAKSQDRLAPARQAEATAGRPETDLGALQRLSVPDLLRQALEAGVTEAAGLSRQQLVVEILRARSRAGTVIRGGGTLELLPEGYGFLRQAESNYLSSPYDIYVSPAQVRALSLRTGAEIEGVVRPPRAKESSFALLQVASVNGREPDRAAERVVFEDLTPLHPDKRLILETTPDEMATRVVDLVTPVGKGQRGLIVSPPRAGKTVLLQKVAQGVLRNHPECYVIVLLIDERPEEVTEMRRHVAGPAVEVFSSTFDAPAHEHIRIAEIVLEKAKRLVESGRDVVILLDSLTRLARAYNALAPNNGKTLSGGVTGGALDRPKRFFGAARNVEEGGSLTILATALIDTGSRMDEVIFEEFKGTGNMELHLNRRLVDKRVWPAIDISRSGTRREELLLDPEEFWRLGLLRRVLSDRNPVEAMELLTARLKKSRSNVEFLMGILPS